MATFTPQVQNIGPLPDLDSCDENSPLLPNKHSYNDGGHRSSSHGSLSNKAKTPQPRGTTPEKRDLICIMISLWVGNFTAGLDGTVMATLAAPIATSFNSLSLLAWLATGYLIGQAATQPLSGKLTDIFSRQWGLVVSNCMFALGNLICGLAKDEWTMILGRIISGIGGGCLNSISTIVVSDLIPLRQRALWQGLSNVFWGLGNGLGGVFGGYMHDTWDWRVAFIAQVPLTLVSLIIISFQFKTIGANTPRSLVLNQSTISRLDFLGSGLLVSTLVLFLVGITTGGNIVPWSNPLAYAPLPLSALFFCAFIYVEKNLAREPVLPLHFLRDRTILFACLTNWFFNMTFHPLMYYIPIYYRIRGASSTQSGNALVPIGITLPLGSLIAGVITSRTGRYKYSLWMTLVLLLAGAGALSTTTLSTPLWLPTAYLVLVGLGTGGMLVVTLVAFTSAVEIFEQALVTSLSYVFRSVGSVMGVAIGSAIYQGVLESSLWSRMGSMDDAAETIRRVRNSLEEVEKLPAQLQTVVRGSYMVALRAIFSTSVGFATMAVVSGLLVRELKLHSTLARDDVDPTINKDRSEED
ncbi:MAG: hypothetical protein Q9186_007185 [Xanthomendoza sp. 1 TL-2023]